MTPKQKQKIRTAFIFLIEADYNKPIAPVPEEMPAVRTLKKLKLVESSPNGDTYRRTEKGDNFLKNLFKETK